MDIQSEKTTGFPVVVNGEIDLSLIFCHSQNGRLLQRLIKMAQQVKGGVFQNINAEVGTSKQGFMCRTVKQLPEGIVLYRVF